MRRRVWEGAALTMVVGLFAVALTFGSIEFPTPLNRALYLIFGDAFFPLGVGPGPNEIPLELTIRRHFLRPIGYTCLGMLALIIPGIVTE